MKLLLITASCLLALTTKAQLKGFSLGPYAEMGRPTGNFEQSNKTGVGVGLGADIRFGKLGLTGSVGYMHFPGKTVTTQEGTFKSDALAAVPIRAGIKFRPIPLIYFKVEGGAANMTKNRGSALIFAPGIGVRLLGLDVEGKFETWRKDQNLSFWGLKASYNF